MSTKGKLLIGVAILSLMASITFVGGLARYSRVQFSPERLEVRECIEFWYWWWWSYRWKLFTVCSSRGKPQVIDYMIEKGYIDEPQKVEGEGEWYTIALNGSIVLGRIRGSRNPFHSTFCTENGLEDFRKWAKAHPELAARCSRDVVTAVRKSERQGDLWMAHEFLVLLLYNGPDSQDAYKKFREKFAQSLSKDNVFRQLEEEGIFDRPRAREESKESEERGGE